MFFKIDGSGPMWLAPAALGLVLIAFGTLILLVPNLLELIIAGFFIFGGFSLIGMSWTLRRKVTYRRMEGHPGRRGELYDEE